MKVRTKFRPDLEVEVSEHEARDLRNQGLLLVESDPEEATPTETKPEPKARAKKTETEKEQ